MNGYNFTERMRRVLAMAREEAIRLRHEYVGTEHLLLAIIREGESVAAAVLQNLGAKPAAMTKQIEGVIKMGKASGPTGPDLPYTSRAKKVLELSMNEAARLQHTYVGTEHLLLGLIAEEQGIAAQVIMENHVYLDAAREETIRLLGANPNSRQATFITTVHPVYPPHLDALIAAPDNHRRLMENEYVRVLETTIDPGQTTPVHTHKWPAAHYVMSWSHFIRRDDAGNILLDTRQSDFNQNVPQVLWGTSLPAHTVENVGSTTLRIVSVELKKSQSPSL
jgi:hypothetical protein